MDDFVSILTDDPADTLLEVYRRCHAAEALSKMGPAAPAEAMPALLRTLVVPVSVDCVLALRVAAAEAVWKVGGRHDLALPFLAWALKDDYWGLSLKAARVLGEMGAVAHEAIPDLVQLADRRCAHGPFYFEKGEEVGTIGRQSKSLLAAVAIALGRCGRGVAHWHEAHEMLTRLSTTAERDVRTVASHALAVLGPEVCPNA
jgi:hypothetical protein